MTEVGRLREIADTINRRDVEQMAEIARLRSLVAALMAANSEKDEALRVLIEDRATQPKTLDLRGGQRGGKLADRLEQVGYVKMN